jgi:hypothetical protein
MNMEQNLQHTMMDVDSYNIKLYSEWLNEDKDNEDDN